MVFERRKTFDALCDYRYNPIMNHLLQFENAIEDLIEDKLPRFLGGQLHPLEIAALLSKALDDGQMPGPEGHSLAPNRFFVFLNTGDYEMLQPCLDTLQEQLSVHLMRVAAENSLRVVGSLRVVLQPMSSIPQSVVRVSAYADIPEAGLMNRGNTEPVRTE